MGKSEPKKQFSIPYLRMICAALSGVRNARELLLGSGAEFSRMTGSGSAVFAMYKDEKTRDAAYDQIRNDPELSGCEVFVSKTV